MIKNYFKIAWRNILKNPVHQGVNIIGLLIGFTVGMMILLFIYSQIRFDNFHANGNRLYEVYHEFNKKDGPPNLSNSFGFPAAPIYKSQVPAVEKASAIFYGGNKLIYDNKEINVEVKLVDEDFLNMFSFPVVSGNNVSALHNLNSIVITESTAKKIFGNTSGIGKIIQASTGNQMQALQVTAVLKDIPVNSSIKFEALTRIENHSDYARDKNNWNIQHHPVYIMLKEGATLDAAETQLRIINKKYVPDWEDVLVKAGAPADQFGDRFRTKLLAFSSIHFSPDIVGNGAISKSQIYALLAVGLLIILIACFNFININLSGAFNRSKEIGIKKCLGVDKRKLYLQFWSECFMVCAISFLLSLALVNVLIHVVNSFMHINIPLTSLMWQPTFLLMGLALLLLVSILAGAYPSWVMARFRVVESLKGKINLKRKSLLRSSLIVAQFIIACVMINCTFIIYKQFKYMQEADLGLNKEYIISVPLDKPEKGYETIEKLRTRLANQTGIISITGSMINIGVGKDNSTSKWTTGFDYKGKNISANIINADYDFLKTLGIKITEGRDFDRSFGRDTNYDVLVSQSLAKEFGEKQLIGRQIIVDSAQPRWNIIGVFPDFHLYSLHEAIQPIAIQMDRKSDISYCFIKTKSEKSLAIMETIKKEMAELESGKEFKGGFLDENVNNWYKQEQMLSILFAIAAAIAILLSCMGLLAMVLLMIKQRVKEIGVRKVLGASVQSLSVLIAKDFLLLVLIAIFIALPISWICMNKWLLDFPYKTPLHWWMFGMVGLLAMFIAMLTVAANTINAARQNPVKSLRTE